MAGGGTEEKRFLGKYFADTTIKKSKKNLCPTANIN
jgi:hypothetical protein